MVDEAEGELGGPTNLVRTPGTYLYTIIIKAKIMEEVRCS